MKVCKNYSKKLLNIFFLDMKILQEISLAKSFVNWSNISEALVGIEKKCKCMFANCLNEDPKCLSAAKSNILLV